jgi:uncharacterized protein YqeY
MLKERLTEEIKNAMKSGDKDRLNVFKMIKAEFQKVETSKGFKPEDFNEAKEISILQKMQKVWIEERDFFRQAGRDTTERDNQILIIESLLPEKVSKEKLIEAIIESGETAEMKNMGKILRYVQQKYPTVTGKEVSETLKTLMNK